MIQINVALPSGHGELLTLLPSSTVQDVRTKAQQAFGQKYLRLIAGENRVLVDPDKTLQETGVEDGECLTALVVQPLLAATKSAFALLCPGDSAIVTWGQARYGGNSPPVRDKHRGVLQIQASYGSFAAILQDGSVVTWGDADDGGDSSDVRDQLKGVQQIQATPQGAFAAILADGSVVTWGDPDNGGDSLAVKDQLKGVQQIQATAQAFAAILADGSVVTWGQEGFGGDSLAVQDQLRGVEQVQATAKAFAAILEDGSVLTWGDPRCGGDSSAVQYQLKGVQQIQASFAAFAAILEDGSVATWGDPGCGGDSSAVRDQLKGVQQIQATNFAFAAILQDGSVVTWGQAGFGGGDSSGVRDQLKGVQQIQATPEGAFAAIWNIQITKEGRDHEAHMIRESWRQSLFASFKQSTRRDAAQIQAVEYDEDRVKLTRRLWRSLDAHGRGVLTGAIVSDARFDVIQRKPIECCQWCGTAATPDWHHLAWQCDGFHATRQGIQVPHDNLQRVLGWPIGGPDDQVILQHLASVRKRLLDRRYRSR